MAVVLGTQRGGCARGLPLSHATDGVAGGLVRRVVGRDHHAGRQQVLDTCDAQRPVRNYK